MRERVSRIYIHDKLVIDVVALADQRDGAPEPRLHTEQKETPEDREDPEELRNGLFNDKREANREISDIRNTNI